MPPVITASTLMVPGYIDEHEIRGIARFIAALTPEIPYSLLAFHPQFRMADLPATSKRLPIAAGRRPVTPASGVCASETGTC